MVETAKRFEDVQIGEEIGPSEFHLSKDQARSYARATGMWVPRFTDDEGARKEGLPGMITPGNMSLAVMSKLVTGKNDDERTAEMDVWIENEEAERLVIGTATVQFPK